MKSKKYSLELLEPHIIKASVFEHVELELEDILEMKEETKELSEGNKFSVLLDATHNFLISSEARIKLSSAEYTKDRVATALVTKSLANKLIGNFFIKINKPASPTKLFAEELPALLWLRDQLKTQGII